MTPHPSTARPPLAVPRSLFAFSIFYGGMVCIAGVLGNKQVALAPGMTVEAGIFAFLLLVVVSSAIAELHGRTTANRLVQLGFLPLVMSMALAGLVWLLPAARSMPADKVIAINTVLFDNLRIWGAGIIAYGVSQTLNVTIFAAMRRGVGKFLWLRAGTASALSQIVDTLIFITVAFYGAFPIGQLIVGQMLAKVALSIVLVPPLIYLFVGLGRWLDGTQGERAL